MVRQLVIFLVKKEHLKKDQKLYKQKVFRIWAFSSNKQISYLATT